MRVLICQAESVIALDLEQFLLTHGYEVGGIAATSARAVELARERRPDLALVSGRLKDGHSGIALIEQLSQLGVPAVLVSGALDLEKAAPHDAVGVLSKPWTPEELKQAIESASKSRAVREPL